MHEAEPDPQLVETHNTMSAEKGGKITYTKPEDWPFIRKQEASQLPESQPCYSCSLSLYTETNYC